MTRDEMTVVFEELFALLKETAKAAGFKRMRFDVSHKMIRRAIGSGYFSMYNHPSHTAGNPNCVNFAFRDHNGKMAKIITTCPDLTARLSFSNNKAARELNKEISWYSGVMLLLEIFIAIAIVEKAEVPTLPTQDKIIILTEKIRNII